MMRVRFAFRSRFPKMIERITYKRLDPVRASVLKPPLETAGYICPKCFISFVTPELRKAHRKQCDFDRLAARAAKMEPRLAKMNPRQRERVESRIKEEFLKLVGRFG
jgi:hypothetical protein